MGYIHLLFTLLLLFILHTNAIMLTHHAKQAFVISTGSRGIGLEFTRQLLSKTQGTTVCALARNVNNSPLMQLQQTYPNRLTIVPVDLENQQSIESATAMIASKTPTLDLLINVAGIFTCSYPTCCDLSHLIHCLVFF